MIDMQDGLPPPRRYWSMAAIGLGITMAVLDSSIANVALPTIAQRVHAAPAAATWVVNAYQLATIVTLLPFAALGERLGYRRVYVAGLVVFTLGSLACALSSTLPALVAARVVQGVGASGIMGMNGALVRHTWPHRLLGRGVGLNALVVALVAGVVLWRRAERRPTPLIPVDLMHDPVFALSVVTSVASFTAYMLAYVALPFYFETVLHRDAVQTGLLMTGWPAALGIAAPIAGALSDRMPAAVLGASGLVVLALGLALLAGMPADATAADILWRMALCGFGFGFFQAPNNRTLLATAPRERAGAAGAMLAISRIVGFTSGATIAAAMFRVAGAQAETVDLTLGSAFALIAAVLSLLRLGRQTA